MIVTAPLTHRMDTCHTKRFHPAKQPIQLSKYDPRLKSAHVTQNLLRQIQKKIPRQGLMFDETAQGSLCSKGSKSVDQRNAQNRAQAQLSRSALAPFLTAPPVFCHGAAAPAAGGGCGRAGEGVCALALHKESYIAVSTYEGSLEVRKGNGYVFVLYKGLAKAACDN
eukprot:1139928-Pelagomonas_calceolata.AAC.1